jgi:hypothetical protein
MMATTLLLVLRFGTVELPLRRNLVGEDGTNFFIRHHLSSVISSSPVVWLKPSNNDKENNQHEGAHHSAARGPFALKDSKESNPPAILIQADTHSNYVPLIVKVMMELTY